MLLNLLVCCSHQVHPVNLNGTLLTVGITSYQYGSHQLISDDSLFALQSSTLELGVFENKIVNISGQLVSGYPLEGGPVLIEVITV